MAKVAVFGIGYVGCVTAGCLSRNGHSVVGVDVDSDKVSAINDGQSPVQEPGLAELVRHQVKAGKLRATSDVEEAVRGSDIGLVCVGTPSRADGSVNTAAVQGVIEAIGRAIRRRAKDYNVVLRSTLLPGILEDELLPLLVETVGTDLGGGLHLCNNPEFLREGSAISDFDHPPFVLVGVPEVWDAADVLDLYEGIRAGHIVTDSRTAAMVKYACNAFHATKVAFANEVGRLATSFAADGPEVMKILCKDKVLNTSSAYLRPGFAFGGSCLPKDLRALTRHAERSAVRTPLLGSVLESNDEHLRRGATRVMESGHRQIGLVGLSFKVGTDDLRESPAVILAETLLGRGYDIKIYDPGVQLSRLHGRNLAYVDQHLPHLAALLVENQAALWQHASCLVFTSDVANQLDWPTDFDGTVIDLREDLVRSRAKLLAVPTP